MKRIVMLLVVVLLAGCGTRPIYNVHDHPIPAQARNLPLDRIQTVIVQAGQNRGLGWSFEKVADGHLLGTYKKRAHKVVVDIYFNQQSYSIIYHSSVAMDAADGYINHHYGSWVGYLESDIERALANAALASS